MVISSFLRYHFKMMIMIMAKATHSAHTRTSTWLRHLTSCSSIHPSRARFYATMTMHTSAMLQKFRFRWSTIGWKCLQMRTSAELGEELISRGTCIQRLLILMFTIILSMPTVATMKDKDIFRVLWQGVSFQLMTNQPPGLLSSIAVTDLRWSVHGNQNSL